MPANYIIGPGDELQIRAWGQIDVDYRAVVDRNGMINIPRVGSISVTGVKYQDLTDHVKSALSRNFRNFEVLVTLGQLRAVQVFVVGYARRPGSYTVSSLSTLVNAIFAAGGPSLSGSMRSVQLKRNNQTVTELDLYDLLLSGDKSKDAALTPGDVIYFPAIGPLAAVSGSVNHPAIFELRSPGNAALRTDIRGTVDAAAASLGFRPALILDGPLDSAVPDEVRPDLLAVLREALSNAVRHARASAVSVTVAAGEGQVRLVVTDNGVGFEGTPDERSGLANMRHRAETLGGAFTIEPGPAGGTRVRWSVPLT